MNNNYFSLGLMSGTSMDGVDASIIQSNGAYEYKTIFNEYMQYDKNLYKSSKNMYFGQLMILTIIFP